MTTPTRILLVDDDQVDRASVRRALGKSGLTHEIVEAADGTSGLERAQAETFDCVLLDYRLPDVDTFDLLKTLVSIEGGQQTVLMLTGESDQEIALRLMRAGALDYLAKAEMTPSTLARSIRYAKARRGFLAELEATRKAAEEKSVALDLLNRQKTLLFSIIAHDLRNPFQAILGLSDGLSQAVASKRPEAVERRAQGVREAAGRVYDLMESLFAWADLQMNTVAVPLTDVDLRAVAQDTIRVVRDAALAKRITLQNGCGAVSVRANKDMLATVLRNLVTNAVKFTAPGGQVAIAGLLRGGTVDISVTDTGIGMPPDRIADLFRLDRRVTSNGTAGERGSGLGLLICRDLVQQLGGELTVRSVVDHGTTFGFALAGGPHLPAGGTPGQEPAPPAAPPSVLEDPLQRA